MKTSLSKVAEKNLQSAFSFFVKDFLPTIQPKTKVKKDQFTA
jgi:hypothetical protein